VCVCVCVCVRVCACVCVRTRVSVRACVRARVHRKVLVELVGAGEAGVAVRRDEDLDVRHGLQAGLAPPARAPPLRHAQKPGRAPRSAAPRAPPPARTRGNGTAPRRPAGAARPSQRRPYACATGFVGLVSEGSGTGWAGRGGLHPGRRVDTHLEQAHLVRTDRHDRRSRRTVHPTLTLTYSVRGCRGQTEPSPLRIAHEGAPMRHGRDLFAYVRACSAGPRRLCYAHRPILRVRPAPRLDVARDVRAVRRQVGEVEGGVPARTRHPPHALCVRHCHRDGRQHAPARAGEYGSEPLYERVTRTPTWSHTLPTFALSIWNRPGAAAHHTVMHYTTLPHTTR
jgi:hypothetical protein